MGSERAGERVLSLHFQAAFSEYREPVCLCFDETIGDVADVQLFPDRGILDVLVFNFQHSDVDDSPDFFVVEGQQHSRFCRRKGSGVATVEDDTEHSGDVEVSLSVQWDAFAFEKRG